MDYNSYKEQRKRSKRRWNFIGVGLLITAMILGLTDSAYSFLAFAAGFAGGLVLLIRAGAKYNR